MLGDTLPQQPGAGAADVQECAEALSALSGRPCVLLAHRATIALVAALRALGLPPGSEVLMPVTLCANPAYAVRLAGLRPLFADISPKTFNMDLTAAEGLPGPHTRVLLAVPLFGQPLDAGAVLDFAARHRLVVVEDAAQAVGLRHSDRPAGSLGLCSVYSFGHGKIADAGGGAALLSDDTDFLARAEAELAAMPLSGQRGAGPALILRSLRQLPDELRGRAAEHERLHELLAREGVPAVEPEVDHRLPLWKYSVLLPDRAQRDRLTRDLLAEGIQATNLYPPLAPFFPEARNASGHFPVAWDVFNRIVNLPLWPLPA